MTHLHADPSHGTCQQVRATLFQVHQVSFVSLLFISMRSEAFALAGVLTSSSASGTASVHPWAHHEDQVAYVRAIYTHEKDPYIQYIWTSPFVGVGSQANPRSVMARGWCAGSLHGTGCYTIPVLLPAPLAGTPSSNSNAPARENKIALDLDFFPSHDRPLP